MQIIKSTPLSIILLIIILGSVSKAAVVISTTATQGALEAVDFTVLGPQNLNNNVGDYDTSATEAKSYIIFESDNVIAPAAMGVQLPLIFTAPNIG